MRQMKDSGIVWIEDIPQEWTVRIAKTIFVRMYRPVRKEDEVITCFRDGEVTLRKNRRTEGFTESLKEIGYQGIRKGDLVIHQMDAFAGSIGISDSDGKGSPVYICLRPQNEEECLNKFYVYLLRQMAECGYIKSLYRGIRERSSDFRFETFATLNLPIPPLPEQRAIADYLDVKCGEVDALVSLQEQMIAELQAYKQAVITEAVTHGLNPNAKMKDSGVQWIGRVPEHWEIAKLKYCMLLVNGRAYSQEELLSEGKYRVLRVGNFFTNETWYFSDMELEDNKYCEKGDLLYAWSASFGPYIWDGDKTIYHYHIWKVLYGSHLKKKYTYYLLKAITNSKLKDTHGSTMTHITMGSMNESYISLPSLSEQQQIAAYLDAKCTDIDALIGLKQQKIEELKEYKKSLIFECVTGKREIQQA